MTPAWLAAAARNEQALLMRVASNHLKQLVG